ncbi:MAG: HDOD domain-containing protein [Spirochaetia bacterium]|jgi:putative nucleotidyltransferase with HDIG domain|nr:HDOD domain-containing protein [Spirochaetia bacterium]
MEKFDKYINNLPIIPDVASKIMAIADDNFDISFKELEEIILIDPMLTARILKVANSAMYARQSEIANLQVAIGLLGFKNIKSLVLLITASQFSKELKASEYMNNFWRHSIATAFIAKHIMHRKKDRANEETAFVAGLLHDIGQAVLFQSDPSLFAELLKSMESIDEPVEVIERKFYKTDHREIGASLLGRWNFPNVYVDVAREHNTLNINSKYKKLVLTITLADILSDYIGYGQREGTRDDLLKSVLVLTNHTEEDLEYFKTTYVEIFEKDPLFKECQRLFIR